ncbi:type VII secretion protein EccB [Streptacidiphilus sp. PB12-B1b]|uniref:type VII secretion protein EccB n=1 Tax=Streptacidiphilus sp. PB12-B1b TaxID=2705012 RepID=UPI0015FA0258|nr:type VII secretion protein EccB [Streptacidiphilus sp. PB12-B1b]QMU77125.1 type VII secretion protein EccB [Streptacidiphilus sp. PB12-B1b]
MQTRRDHLHAYRFAMGRLATALLTGDPGRGDNPTGRAALGTFLGAGVVVLLCAGFGVYGLISPPANSSWRTPGSIVVQQQTGSRYLYLGGQLRPVLNYSSALLILGGAATVRDVPASSLGSTPYGSPVGIADAPDALPAPAALLTGPWTRCLRGDLPGGEAVDFAPGGRTAGLPAGHQALLTGPDGSRYLLWAGVLHPVPSASALIALGLDGDQALPAPQSWLDALPAGTPLAAAPVTDAGRAAAPVAGQPTAVGQLFATAGAGSDHDYVMTADGIAPVGATEAALLAARPGAAAVRTVAATALAAAPVSSQPAPGGGLPDVLDAPALATGGGAVCLRQQADGAALSSSVVIERGAAATGGRAVLVPPTGGVLAVDQQQLAQQVSDPQTYLITDQGIAYPLGDSQAQQTLGLGNAPALPLPSSLLTELPHGPTLDTSAARLTVKGG